MRWLPLMLVMLGLLLAPLSSAQAQAPAPKPGAATNTANVVNQTQCDNLRNAVTTNSSIVETIMWGGGEMCPCSPEPSLWIERVVSCFAEVPGGLLYNSVGQIIAGGPYHTFYNTLVYATVLLAIVLFGINLTLGSVQSIPKDSFLLMLKVGGVVLFFNHYMEVYSAAMTGVQDLAEKVGDAAGGLGNICAQQFNGKDPTLWARWDCLFQKFTGIVGGYLGIGIIGFITAFLFSGGTAAAIFIGTGYVILTILLIAMRLVYTYLVAIMAVSFLFLLAPLFVPMLLFGQTYQKFATWFKLIIAYMMQPMILILFMVLMLTALEFAIFVGPTSLFGAFSNTNPQKSMTFSEVMNRNSSGGGIAGMVTAVTGSGSDWNEHIKPQPLFGFTRHSDAGVITANQNQPDAADMTGANTGIGGMHPTLNSGASTATPESSHSGGWLFPSVDFDGMMDHINRQPPIPFAPVPTISKETWMANIMTQLVACSILVFILYNLVHAIPQITHDLIAQRFGRGFGGATKARMIGESEMRKSVEGIKETIRRGKESGDHSHAAQTVLAEAINNAASGRGGGA